MARRVALLVAAGTAATGSAALDSEALVQQTVATHRSSVSEMTSVVERLLAGSNASWQALSSQAQQHRKMFSRPAMKDTLAEYAHAISDTLDDKHRQKMVDGWKEFVRQAESSSDAHPHELLRKAKIALLQTGAMEEMRKVAIQTAKASTKTQGAVPLDSMVVGFYSTWAPWNNVLRIMSLPLIKTRFSIFTNFFGPEGNAARLCLKADIAADSTYGVHARAEFGGVGAFVGPAKWDNVPGWRFGASGGLDDVRIFDVADFGWDWTLAEEPETVGFHFDLQLADHEDLQRGISVSKAAAKPKNDPFNTHNHGSTFIGHIWCSPDWDNTPLVIVPSGSSSGVTAALATGGEVYDPANEAV